MEVSKALLSYLIFVILIFFIAIRLGIYPYSSITLSLLFGQIFLNILCPPNSKTLGDASSGNYSFYLTIQILTPILAVLYVVIKALEDKRPYSCLF